MRKIFVPLEQDERKALLVLADREKRDPRYQAALFVRQGLERAGLLNSESAQQGVSDASKK